MDRADFEKGDAPGGEEARTMSPGRSTRRPLAAGARPASGLRRLIRRGGWSAGAGLFFVWQMVCASAQQVTVAAADPMTPLPAAMEDQASISGVDLPPLKEDLEDEALTAAQVEAQVSDADAPALPVAESQPSVEITPGAGAAVSSIPRRFRYKLGVQVREVYDNNIDLARSDRRSDFYTAIEPRVILGLGDLDERQENFLRLDYSPALYVYAEHSDNNAFQQVIRLDAQYRFQRLVLELSQDIQLLESADISTRNNLDEAANHVNLDVSGRTRVNIFTTILEAAYDLSSKTFLSAALSNTIYDYRRLLDSQSVTGNLYLNYRYSPKLVVGAGVGGGVNRVDPPTPDQTSEQVNARVEYEISGKFALNASGGVEFRQFEGENRGVYTSPVFELGASYRPFDGTRLGLIAQRRTSSSAVLAGQDYATTNFTLEGRQRLFRRLFLGIAGGYEHSEYFSVLAGVEATRRDNYFFLAPSIDVMIARYWSLGIYDLYRKNDTSDDSFSFQDNQIGFRSSFIF